VAYRNGSPIRLEQLGRVIDSVENDRSRPGTTTTRTIYLIVQRQPGSNTVEVVDAIRSCLPSFREQMPPSVKLDILYDRSQAVRESVNDVKFTLVLTVALVIMVIFLFLRNVSATVIPSLALPHVDHRHVRRHGAGGLHAGQPFADGADAFGGFRGGPTPS